MALPVEWYREEDLEQHLLGARTGPSEADTRTQFQHDRDRILYSSAFRALAGKTQVVASAEAGGYHNRLTHSLKVAQLGRRLAEKLTAEAATGPDPDLVEAICLAHDIGHPPFGHAGETALCAAVDRRSTASDGFEGNAQNLRILTCLASRKTRQHRGLHLSRAVLDGMIKYPWRRTLATDDVQKHKKYGIYAEDVAAAEWILGEHSGRPVEEQIMDWADDVTYACHDVEDFFRTGLIPLHLLLDFRAAEGGSLTSTPSAELAKFLDTRSQRDTASEFIDRDEALEIFRELQSQMMITAPFDGSHSDKVLSVSMTSRLIGYMLEGVHLEAVGSSGGALVRYRAKLIVPPNKRRVCTLLKSLIWYYVINRPSLASQQHGQREIVSQLFVWHCEDADRLLPADRPEEYAEHGNLERAASDRVASLTESQAVALYKRMRGIEQGAITDHLY